MQKDILKSFPEINSNYKIQFINYPFSAIIIDDFFTENHYKKISDFCEKETRELKLNNKEYPFKQEHFTPASPFHFFSSPMLKSFISSIFNIQLNNYLYISLFSKRQNFKQNEEILNGAQICSVFDQGNQKNQIIENENYQDDSEIFQSTKIIRSVLMLYFIDGKGQEAVGLYSEPNKKSLSTQIKSKKNRVVFFENNPKTYFNFLPKENPTSFITQWFHSNPSYYLNRNLDLISTERIEKNLPFVERWNHKPLWDIEKDKEYLKYFGTINFYSLLQNKDLIKILNLPHRKNLN
jgi:hypothetical protein